MHSHDDFPVRDIFSLIIRATASDTVESLSNLDDSNERRRKAIENILYSRRFAQSYNLVLLTVIFCYAAWYWVSRFLRARRLRARGHGKHHGASSRTDSTRKGDGETTPLLGGKLHPNQSGIQRISPVIKSWSIYQPADLPYFRKVFPSNATTFTILLFLGLNLFYLFYRVPLSLENAFIFADRAGLLFVANLPVLYILAAKNQPLKLLADASYEGLNIFHRRLGEWMCLLAILHGGSMLLVYYVTLSSRLSLSRFLALPIIWLGLLAFASYEMLYVTSLGSFRQRFYELFLALHICLQATALGFLFFHHHNSRPYVLIALAIFAVDRLVFRLWLKSRTIQAELSVLGDGETVMLSSNWHLQAYDWWKSSGLDIRSGWKPSEHIFLTVPALSHKHVVQAHPFTIASAAPQGPGSHAWLNFVIRAQDGFSRDLLRYAQLHRTTNIRVDGPYGSLHALHMIHDNEVAVVVAGGSGIAVAFPLVWDLFTSRPRDQESGHKSRVSLIWIVKDTKHLDWIPQDRLEELREFGCKIILPSPTNKAGRPDLPLLLEGAIAAWNDELEDPTVGVVVSGPDGMNRTCRNACASLVRQGVKLDVAIEKFGW